MEQRISMVTIGVTDVNVSKAFYENLGWKASEKSSEDMIFFPMPGIVFGIYPKGKLAEDAGIPFQTRNQGGITLSHNARSKEDADRLFDLVKACGGEIIKPAQDTFWGGYGGYFADPDGHLWEIAYNPFIELDELGSMRV